ncbi:PST family polysaccharide transporter [Nocardioides ginsengisegetis]|uniref:PST family polysaccharide transporter n=1 Tax=Nocardioides ginsengisegetis TaxID=661491 RepID=A0A7W3J1X5_9ACTN|nr:oligosaccharide flippase family protein [Nocardioides ginsengisegetis]MBA8804639.1 PST family polysaccharide transporter [Nocardioides ginsengisegetis]
MTAVEVPGGPSMGRRMQHAALWTSLNSFVLRLAQFAVGVVVARLVAPEQFGVFAVALIVHAIVSNISDLGVSAAIVRADRSLHSIAPTVLTIALTASSMLTASMFFAAPVLATSLGAPEAASAIRILSFTVLLGGLTSVPYGILVRDFRQDKRFVADVLNFVVSTAAVIVLAKRGWGADGLAWSRLGGQLVSWAVLVAMITPRFRPGWRRSEARAVLRYCLPLAGASVVAFALTNVDSVIVGRELGPLALGLYALAYNVAGWPVSVFGMMINEVALPAFAHVRRDWNNLPARLAAIFALAAAVALPVSLCCLALADSLVVSVYGPTWGRAAPVLAVLGVFGSMRILLTVLTIYLTAVGASRSVLAIQGTWIAALVPALMFAVHSDGIVGAGVAQPLVAVLVVCPLAFWAVRRHGGGSAWHLLRACARPALGTCLVGATLLAVRELTTPGWTQLLVAGTLSLLVYAASTGPWVRRHLRSIRQQWDAHDAAQEQEPARA